MTRGREFSGSLLQCTAMDKFIVLHRGVPIGIASCSELREEPFTYSFLDFTPNASFASVRHIVQRASHAAVNFGFIGPAADPASAAAGREALAAADLFCAGLEITDTAGRPVPGRVTWLTHVTRHDGTAYLIDLDLDSAETGA